MIRTTHYTITELIELLQEYKSSFGNLEVKFEAFEYKGLCPDTDEHSATKIESYCGKQYLNIELK